MNAPDLAASINRRIKAGAVIRANDPNWTRPLVCVKVEGEVIEGSARPDRRFLKAVDVYGFTSVVSSLYDSAGAPIMESLICVDEAQDI